MSSARPINLMPLRRRQAQTTARRTRSWILFGTVYASALSVALVIVQTGFRYNRTGIEHEIDQVRTENLAIGGDLDVLNAEATAVDQQRATRTAVGRQPNWGILLAKTAEALSSESAVLRTVRVSPVLPDLKGLTAAQKADRDHRPVGFDLQLTGVAKSQEDVDNYVAALEEVLGVFEDVQPRTKRTTFRGHEAIAFDIDCTLNTSKVQPRPEPTPENEPVDEADLEADGDIADDTTDEPTDVSTETP